MTTIVKERLLALKEVVVVYGRCVCGCQFMCVCPCQCVSSWGGEFKQSYTERALSVLLLTSLLSWKARVILFDDFAVQI